jgi:hypothetical protein
MTPAQLAKEYAAANGFTIIADGARRYNVLFDGSLIKNVGSYAAALNAMYADTVCPNPVTGARGDGSQPSAKLHPEFEDFNEASKARIRRAARIIKASCAVPKPWVLCINGYEYGNYGSRTEAVKASRQRYNDHKKSVLSFMSHTSTISYIGAKA